MPHPCTKRKDGAPAGFPSVTNHESPVTAFPLPFEHLTILTRNDVLVPHADPSHNLKTEMRRRWPEECRMKIVKISNAIFFGVAFLLATQCVAQQTGKDAPMP